MPRRDGVRPTNAKDNVRPEDDMGHSVAGACLEEPAVLTAFPSLLHPQDPPQQRDRILFVTAELSLSLIHISEPTRHFKRSRMPSSA